MNFHCQTHAIGAFLLFLDFGKSARICSTMATTVFHLGLLGHKGRLGSRISELLANRTDFSFEPILRDATYETEYNVIIDVSSVQGTTHMLTSLLALKKTTPVVIGTTGDLPFALINEYSQRAPVALVSNFSIGVPQFIDFLKILRADEWQNISMIERHHIHKLDKPSGTAKTLASHIKRPIEIEAVREGEIIGEHELILDNEYERIVMTHTAKDRGIFAAGALRYARWLPLQKPGLYTGIEKKKLKFAKYQGCGNDFVFIENKSFPVSADKKDFVVKTCSRGTSVGADGVIFVEKQDKVVYWEYFNSDGSLVAMCGNGARCVGAYAFHQNWDCDHLRNSHGVVQRFTLEDGVVCVEMPKPTIDGVPEGIPALSGDANFSKFAFGGLYTIGVPHAVFEVEDVDNVSPNPIGEAVRAVIDVNTNIYTRTSPTSMTIRTYERGVYDETLACGSGCCSVAYHLWKNEKLEKGEKYSLKVRSGLTITVRIEDDGTIFLAGPTSKVFEGVLEDF